MTHDTTPWIDRRTVLKGSGVALAGLGGLATPVAAKGKRVSLLDGPAEFQLFWSGADGDPTDADEPADFGYPSDPSDLPFDGSGNGAFLGGEDPTGGLFDASDIEMTPNGKTLHHTLQFFGGFLMDRNRGKPYTLVNEGIVPVSGIPGLPAAYRFAARGQHITFDAVSQEELIAALGQLADASVEGSSAPLFSLAGGRWRAVGSEVLYVAPDPDNDYKPGRIAPFSSTRVDFYTRSRGRPAHALSLLYVIYPDFDPDPADPANGTGPLLFQSIPQTIYEEGLAMVSRGPLNLGGQ